MDLAPAIREAILHCQDITQLLSTWNSVPSVHTRVPVPDTATYPLIVIPADVTFNDMDGLTSFRSVIVRDVMVYGEQPTQYRSVERVGYLLRELFHRKRLSLVSDDFRVVSIEAVGPRPAPTSDANLVGRVVTLTVQVQAA